MKRLLATLLLSAVAFGAASAIVVPDASACGNKMHRFKKKKTVLLVERADWDISQHRYRKALQELSAQWDNLEKGGHELGQGVAHAGTFLRAVHLAAVAVVRSSGKWEMAPEGGRLGGDARQANVDWATKVLEVLAGDETDSTARAHYAEALALTADTRPTARTILEDLAAKGEISESAVWDLLAELRTENGEEKKAEVARANAEQWSKSEETGRPSKYAPRKAKALPFFD